jgi:single-stranded DNA-specific DHH superfamily exonuclease
LGRDLLKTFNDTLLIHHWDTDGICSASIILQTLQEKISKNLVPQLGRYSLVKEEFEFASRFDHVIIVDISLPESDVLKLSKNSKVAVFDHHIQPRYDIPLHHNPILDGFDPLEYPAATIVVSNFLCRSFDILSYLGAVGDRGIRIKQNPVFWRKLTRFMEEEALSFNQLLQMTELLDSINRVGDKGGVEKAPFLLLGENVRSIISEQRSWLDNLVKLEKAISAFLSTPPELVNGVQLKFLNTKFNIISKITRKLAWDTGKDTIVVNKGFLEGYAQVYVRSTRKNLEPLIALLSKKGFSVGGKKDVLGALIPLDTVDLCIEIILQDIVNN